MALTPQHTDVVQPEDLAPALLGSDDTLVQRALTEGGAEYAEGVRACRAATDAIETYLSRPLIVRAYTEYVDASEWIDLASMGRAHPNVEQDDGSVQAYPYRRYLRAWPALSGTQDMVIDPEGARAMYSAAQHKRIDYYAGYRRSDQTLTTLKDAASERPEPEHDLADLIVLPPALPSAIVDVAVQLALAELERRIKGLVGIASQRLQLDTGAVENRRFAYQNDFEERQLQRLEKHRRMTV